MKFDGILGLSNDGISYQNGSLEVHCFQTNPHLVTFWEANPGMDGTHTIYR